MSHNIADILAGIRRRAYSTDTTAWPDADLIALTNEVVAGQVVPWIEASREDHFLKYADQALFVGQNNYVMPSDVQGSQLFSVHMVDANGNILFPAPQQLALEDFTQLPTSSSGQPYRYAIRGNEVLLYPVPNDRSQKLRLQYARRPSNLVTRAEVVAVVSIVQTTGSTFTVTFSDAQPTAFPASTGFDLVRQFQGFEVYAGGAPVSQTSTTVVLSGTLPSAIGAGDWLCKSREAPVLTYVPEELWPVVYQGVVVEMAASKGDDAQVSRAEAALKRLIKAAGPMLQKRVTAAHRKIPGGARFGWNTSIWPRFPGTF